jgi:hypothetical protein
MIATVGFRLMVDKKLTKRKEGRKDFVLVVFLLKKLFFLSADGRRNKSLGNFGFSYENSGMVMKVALGTCVASMRCACVASMRSCELCGYYVILYLGILFTFGCFTKGAVVHILIST